MRRRALVFPAGAGAGQLGPRVVVRGYQLVPVATFRPVFRVAFRVTIHVGMAGAPNLLSVFRRSMRLAVETTNDSWSVPMSTPDLFTITEAAVVLRIGRTTAYELARRDLSTGGGEGLGVIRVGGQLRVPRAALERLIGAPIVVPVATLADNGAREHVAVTVLPTSVPDETPARVDHPSSASGSRRRSVSVDQLRFDS